MYNNNWYNIYYDRDNDYSSDDANVLQVMIRIMIGVVRRNHV